MKATKFTTIFSIGILFSFFLTWVEFSFLSFSGYELPTSIDKLITISKVFSNEADLEYLYLIYFVYLAPFLAFINIIFDLTKATYRTFINEYLVGIFVCFFLFILTVSLNNATKLNFEFGIGFYLTCFFSFFGLFTFRYNIDKPINRSIPHPNNNFNPHNIKQDEKSALINQLAKLHDLKEKGVLTESIYETERKEILDKLEGSTNRPISESQVETKEVSSDNSIEIDEEYERLFGKKKSRSNKNIILFFSYLIVSCILLYLVINKQDKSFIDEISSQLINNRLSYFKDNYNEGDSVVYEKMNNEAYLEIKFSPFFKNENDEPVKNGNEGDSQCLEKITLYPDSIKLNKEGYYKDYGFVRKDIDIDGDDDYIVIGKYLVCSESEAGSLFGVYLNQEDRLQLSDVLFIPKLDWRIKGDLLFVNGIYESNVILNSFKFDNITKKWVVLEK